MNNAMSLAAQAAAAGPPTLAPTSFAGMDWLFVINLAMAALGFLLLSFAARDVWRT